MPREMLIRCLHRDVEKRQAELETRRQQEPTEAAPVSSCQGAPCFHALRTGYPVTAVALLIGANARCAASAYA